MALYCKTKNGKTRNKLLKLSCVERGEAVPYIVKLICYLYANSCAAVNLCHRLLEERWDGGNIVGAGGWRLAEGGVAVLNVLNVLERRLCKEVDKKGRKKCHCIYSTSFKCNGPTGVFPLALYNIKGSA
jgi:hypothetical protein